MSTRLPCPADSELAALAEGRLAPGRRDEVVAHALTCGDCKDVLASLGHHLTERRAESAGLAGPRRWAAAAGLLLVIAGGWWGTQWWRSQRAPGAPIEQLARATGERRLVEARLSGSFAWAPVDTVRGETPRTPQGPATRGSDTWEIAGIAAQISGAENADTHALGVAHLLLGNVDEAIATLERASRQAPGSAAVWSDFAAALIERGKGEGRAEDVVRGLDAAQTALGLAPELPIAKFNRALALERLGLREAAIEAWEEYRRLDPDSDWGREATSRLEKLRALPVSRRFSEDAAAFETACAKGDAAAIDELMRRHPQEASEALMAGLGAWAELELAGSPEAGARIEAIGHGAESMSRIVGDPLVKDAVEEIREADPRRRRKLAEAHRLLVQGRAELDKLRVETARPQLRDAERKFNTLQSRYVDIATLYRLSSTYYLGESRRALLEIEALAREAGRPRIVHARARWLHGMALGISGHPFEAAITLDAAERALEALAFRSDTNFVRSTAAAFWWTLGQTAPSWERRRQAFRDLPETEARRAQALVSQAARNAEIQGFRLAALDLQRIALAFSPPDSSIDRCDGLIWLAGTAFRAKQTSLAHRVTQEARQALNDVEDATLRRRLDAELSLVESRLIGDRDSSRSLEAAARATAWLESSDNKYRLLEAYQVRARAQEVAGHADRAADDYLLALETAEAQRDELGSSIIRATFFDTLWRLGRDMVALELRRDRSDRALALADRVRSTSLFAMKPVDDPVSLLKARLKPGQGVIFYSVLEDHTVAWVVRHDTVTKADFKVSETELQDDCETYYRAMGSGVYESTLISRRALHGKLVAPLRSALQGVSTVAIVPDGPLHRISFGSLIDDRTGRAWIDAVGVAVAPAIRCLLGTGGRHTRRPQRVVVIGDPKFDQTLHPHLKRLPGANREAREIGALYSNAEILIGADATAERVLTASSRADVLHVAAHAVTNPIDPELSMIVLAPGGAIAPTGALTATDIRGRSMARLELVVLAACRTGDGPQSRMEGPMSLARPFFENGARSVLVSLWELPDDIGASLMHDLHAHLRAGVSAVEAVRKVSSACWSAPDPDPRSCGGFQLVVNEFI